MAKKRRKQSTAAARSAPPPPRSARRWLTLAALAAAGTAAVLGAVMLRPNRMSETESHALMLDVLAALQDNRADNPYLGEGAALKAKLAVQALGEQASAGQRVRAHWRLAAEQLRLGQVDASIAELDAAEQHFAAAELSPAERQEYLLLHALAHLRQGENENCVHCEQAGRCLFPIRGQGVYDKPDGPRRAIPYLRRLLDADPDHLEARWLLNIAHMMVGDYPQQPGPERLIAGPRLESEAPFAEFVDEARAAGVNTFSLCGGVAMDDFTGDGIDDIVTSSWDTAGQLRLFAGRGDGTFGDRTADAGLEGIVGGLNVVHADYDNDGDNDLLVLRGAWLKDQGRHPNSLLQNDGGGRFVDVTFRAGLGEQYLPSQTAAWSDFDNDGDLDLLVGNEGHVCQLFRNDGRGYFEDIAAEAGLDNRGIAKGVAWGDYDGDDLPDIYISNLGGRNRLYRNFGGGRFLDVAPKLGVSGPRDSFPIWFWDYNNDGHLDLYVASYTMGIRHVAADFLGLPPQSEGDRLYEGDGTGFRDVAAERGLVRVTQPMGANFGDLDYDGYPDIYLGTGYPGYDGLMPNLVFKNDAGRGFVDVTTAGGFGHLQKGHGVAMSDLDRDGDLDVFVQMGGFFPGDAFEDLLLKNPGFDRRWLAVRLRGVRSNRSAIGARLKATVMEGGVERQIYRWVGSGGSFGASPFTQFLGLGQADQLAELEVYWPATRTTQTFRQLPMDRAVEIEEGAAAVRPLWGP